MNNKNSSSDLAIDIAVQTTQLLIALATSILAFTVTFSKEFNDGIITSSMKVSWIFLSVSIIAGIFVLQKIIGELAMNEKVSLYLCSIKFFSIIQNIFFVLGALWLAGSMFTK